MRIELVDKLLFFRYLNIVAVNTAKIHAKGTTIGIFFTMAP